MTEIRGERAIIKIDRLAFGGSGIGNHEGLVVFVPLACPGDLVSVEFTKKKKSFAEARILEVLEESPHRQEPPCKHFGNCGGCDLQHIQYPSQLEFKKQALESLLARQLKFELPKIEIIGSPKEFHYRNRIQLNQQKGRFGYFEKGRKSFTAIENCLIAREEINKTLTLLESQFKRFEIYFDGQDTHVSPTEYGGSEGSFIQVNPELNEILIKRLIQSIEINESKLDNSEGLFVELYSGDANFTLPLLERFSFNGYSIELNQKNVERAREKLNPINGFKVMKGSAEDINKVHPGDRVKHMLVDPPRDGLSQTVVDSVMAIRPQCLYYISCHPATLVRDLKILKDQYDLLEISAFDMFPQTGHLEVFCSLKLKTP